MIELRPYQKAAVEKILWAKRNALPGNDLVVLPTGAGKSIVIAHVVKELNEPILILQPSKEILEQNLEKLLRYVDASEVGVYSASMDQKTVGRYTLATIQSIYKTPQDFAHFKLVVIDEAHLVNPKNLDGMFTSFLKAIGNPKCVGLTATPYRQSTMYVREEDDFMRVTATTKLINRMKPFFWQRLLYNINVGDLIDQKFLCPLEYIDKSLIDQEELELNKTGTDFDLESYVKKISDKRGQILHALRFASDISTSALVFCSSVAQAEKLAADTEGAEVVTGKTPGKERSAIIGRFKDGTTRIVFNVGVLTTGFDHPALDCIVLARPTRSIALYYQMLGRGLRIAPGKTSCKIIDLTDTVKTLGKVETIKMVKREKWELESETGSWHNKELFSFQFELKTTQTAAAQAKENFLAKYRAPEAAPFEPPF